MLAMAWTGMLVPGPTGVAFVLRWQQLWMPGGEIHNRIWYHHLSHISLRLGHVISMGGKTCFVGRFCFLFFYEYFSKIIK